MLFYYLGFVIVFVFGMIVLREFQYENIIHNHIIYVLLIIIVSVFWPMTILFLIANYFGDNYKSTF